MQLPSLLPALPHPARHRTRISACSHQTRAAPALAPYCETPSRSSLPEELRRESPAPWRSSALLDGDLADDSLRACLDLCSDLIAHLACRRTPA
jgi:hypothetical protein